MQATQSCPDCGTALPINEGFVTWCHACGWNLVAPDTQTQGGSRFDRLYAAAGRRLGDRLAGELLSAEQLEPRLTPSRLGAYAIAVLTTLTTFVFAVGGILLVTLAFPNPAALVVGPLLVGLAWLMRPRLGKAPDEDLVARADAPSLYALADEVAADLGLRGIDVLVVDHRLNASWSVVGLRRRRVLMLGLPLLMLLQPQQRVALIAHELAHERNGDATHGLVVGSSVRALAEFYAVIAPEQSIGGIEWSDLSLFDMIVNAVLWVVSRPAYGLLLLELHLLLQDSRRAEYLADALAARVAGTDAVIGLHERLLLESVLAATVQRATHMRRDGASLFDDLQTVVSRVPDRELERRRRTARLEDARLGSTHPPTAKRIELLEGRPALEPHVVCSAERAGAIDAELRPRHRAVATTLIANYRDSLYAR